MTAVNTLRKNWRPPGGWNEMRAEAVVNKHKRTEALVAHREAVEGGVTVPTIKVPNRRMQLRFRGACQFCGGSMFDLRLPSVDLEHPHVSYRGSVDCMLCGRTCATLVIGEERARTPLTDEELKPKPGRPSRMTNQVPPVRQPCMDCGTTDKGKNNARCFDCNKRHREGASLKGRMIAALSEGRPYSRLRLCGMLGIVERSLKHLIRDARLDGHAIVLTTDGYVLEGRR